MMTDEFMKMPEGWTAFKLQDISKDDKSSIKRGPFGSAIRKEFFVTHGYKVYEQKNVIYNDFNLGSYYINEEKFNELFDFEVKPGDILISCSGTIGKIAVVPYNAERGIINQALLKISLESRLISTDYFVYLLGSEIFQKVFLGNTRGSAMQNIASIKALKQAKILLPPLNEQKRIVAKIEALQERSQRVKAELVAIRPLLDKFRQSVLAAAFRGDLTKDWREKNPDIEPASVLLERIKIERRRRWEEAELEKMKAAGKTPKDDKWKQKYKEPEPLNSDNLPQLPDGWCWVSHELLIQETQNGLAKRKGLKGKPIPVLRLADVKNNKIDPEEPRKILLEDNEINKYSIHPNNLLCVRVNGSEDLVGRLILFDRDDTWAFCDHFIRLIMVEKLVDVIYIYNYFLTKFIRQYIIKNKVSSAGQNTVSQTTLTNISVPLTSLEEQKEIVNRIEKIFKIADNIEHLYQQTETDLETLNQSILAKAFRGELVPQNPNDEPASVLLERIRKERATDSKPAKQTRKKPPKTDNNNSTQLTLEGIE
ncbi:restriction endonuclease subunit S [Limnoraphis robusta]|uniref:Restriction endonuclease subunit S n=1 Tax=Limnoraphis robusta CCNP1315 TaxID=3110306 RepID=A0ABU5U0G9_9CYAN|nr:restriction endonuclease subunit S [Limnoraphis robusta]MEA5520422.1 restriction endonuclease subunit S [Limnoraphis robusta CCNP1315]MEA5546941.1 restriction endonuclease subunit S [Limnoraphis robusta CCNP1324]